MVYLKNSQISITIKELGAEVIEGKFKNGKDFIWTGVEGWSDHAPILFPICGRVLDNKYSYEGKVYDMPFHGFAHCFNFEVLEKSDETALLSLKYNEETLKMYPFKFEFRIRYTLIENKVEVTYETINLDKREILFSAGGHEGFLCDKGVENYYVEFDNPVTLNSCKLNGSFLNGNTEKVVENGKRVNLRCDGYRSYDLIFKDIDFTAVTLYSPEGKKMVRAEFEGFPNLLIWSIPDGKFVCIEPWCGLPDFIGDKGCFEEKRGLIKVPAGESYTLIHSYTVFE